MSESNFDLIVKIAHLYYRQRLTQGQVAARVGLSRQTVSRLLQRAEDTGIVNVEIRVASDVDSSLGDGLQALFPSVLTTVVASNPKSPSTSLRTVARTAARFCDRRLTPGITLGVAWGNTVLEFARGLSSSPHADLTVVQIDGSIPGGAATGGSEYVVHEAADSLGATSRPLISPLYVDTPDIRDALMSDTRTSETLAAARASDLVVFSTGTVNDSSGLRSSGFLSSAELAELASEGAVGEVCGQFFTLDGQPCGQALAARSISLTLGEISTIPLRMLIAAGAEKGEATLGALNVGLATNLFVDTELAQRILEIAGHTGR